MRLQIKVVDGIITDARFKTYGCGSAIASSSLITELVKGMSLDQASSIKNSEIAEELVGVSQGKAQPRVPSHLVGEVRGVQDRIVGAGNAVEQERAVLAREAGLDQRRIGGKLQRPVGDRRGVGIHAREDLEEIGHRHQEQIAPVGAVGGALDGIAKTRQAVKGQAPVATGVEEVFHQGLVVDDDQAPRRGGQVFHHRAVGIEGLERDRGEWHEGRGLVGGGRVNQLGQGLVSGQGLPCGSREAALDGVGIQHLERRGAHLRRDALQR